MGVPHTEVDLIVAGGRSVDFGYQPNNGDRVSVYPVFEAFDISSVSRVRPRPLRRIRFVADVHLGRLARYLRLLGFDTLYRNDWGDEELVTAATSERRVLLTRDRGVLKRETVDHGYLVRETDPRCQLDEVLERFDLRRSLRPFTRCPACNGCVQSVHKDLIVRRLPPRTAQYYEEFWRCEECDRLYWKGSHYRSIEALVQAAKTGSGRDAGGRAEGDLSDGGSVGED